MLKIDNNLLQDLGLAGLPDAEKNSLLKHIYETLEMRVGMRLADQMTNQQLDEFEQYFEAKDDAGAFKWLETNFPNYKDIVQEEFEKLKSEVGVSAPQILAASPGAQAAAVVPVAPLAPQPQVAAPAPQQPAYAPAPVQAAPLPPQPVDNQPAPVQQPQQYQPQPQAPAPQPQYAQPAPQYQQPIAQPQPQQYVPPTPMSQPLPPQQQ
jgi:hypothetical protein